MADNLNLIFARVIFDHFNMNFKFSRRMLLLATLLGVWLFITWLLLLGIRNMPAKTGTEDERPFEIIPGSEN